MAGNDTPFWTETHDVGQKRNAGRKGLPASSGRRTTMGDHRRLLPLIIVVLVVKIKVKVVRR
jgi:hypothetical protein